MAAWRELAAQAIEPNVFYDPVFALAAAKLLGGEVFAVLVWTTDPSRRLAGLFFLRVERHRYAVPLPVLVAWTHPYAPLGTPLVHRDLAEPVLEAWLDYIAHERSLPALLLMQLFNEEGPFAAAFVAALARRGGAVKSFGRHRRALFEPGDHRQRYFERTMPARRRRDLRRQWRRLEQRGPLILAELSKSSELRRGFENFLLLESSGWKGRAGTAAACHAGVRDFMQEVVIGLGQQGQASVYELRLDAKPIASAVVLKSGDIGWTWKIAFDEGYSAYSPGVLLMQALTKSLAADTAIRRVDSCAVPTHMMINHLWAERVAIADCLLATSAEAALSFAMAARLESLRRAAIAVVKSIRDRLRAH